MANVEKKLVLACCTFLVLTVLVMAAVMERVTQVTKYGKDKYFTDASLPMEFSASSTQSSSARLKADIKGSIYENGSNMTVFGACFNGDSYLLPEANATFTAWYPNGSLMVGPNATMFPILDDFQGNHPNGTGRWGIQIIMNSTIGTYLTEIRCDYNGEWAVAFGEWQNPEWVQRIGATQSVVNSLYNLTLNVSSQISAFQNSTAGNLTQIENTLAGLNATINATSTDSSTQLRELKAELRDLDLNRWVLDAKNPFYLLASGVHQFTAVDMLASNDVAAVSSDGYFAEFDGDAWTEVQLTGTTFNGVSVLPSNGVYAWGVGNQTTTPIISVNGANATSPSLPSGTPTSFNDARLFQQPNDPAGIFWIYLLGNDGSIYFSADGGLNYSLSGTISAGYPGRISQIVENFGNTSQLNGYQVMIGQGSNVWVSDGVSNQTFTVSGTVKDVSLVYADLGYVAVKGASTADIYKYTGSGLTLMYSVNDSVIQPVAISAHDPNDIWVVTNDPSTFFHFDGHSWKYDNVGFSNLVSVLVVFGNVTGSGMTDASMSDSRHGYAVGTDGVILVYKSEEELFFDQLINQFNQTNNTLLAINASLSADLFTINSTLNDMNATINLKLDNILNNVTYTNLYLTTTIFPLLNSTYQNTLQILINLGIIQSQLNQSINLTNQTLQIVTGIDQNVSLLVNRSNRIHAWVTQ